MEDLNKDVLIKKLAKKQIQMQNVTVQIFSLDFEMFIT